MAWDIAQLGLAATGLAQARLFQLSAYMLTLSLSVIGVAALLNWRNDRLGYRLNLLRRRLGGLDVGAVVVISGDVDPVRGLAPQLVFVVNVILATPARRSVPRAGMRRLPTL